MSSAQRRLARLQHHLCAAAAKAPVGADSLPPLLLDPFDAAAFPATVEVGTVRATVTQPRNPELVPLGWTNDAFSSSQDDRLRALSWMLQKDMLGQDMFLLCAPGPLGRRLAFAFAELTAREAVHVALTPDSTEADLKQRREIAAQSLVFAPSPIVEAALAGRVVVLEGLERAERGVATTLNNLLENREMALESGSFLCSAARFDTLSEAERGQHHLLRVHERFRVICVGPPVPRYDGSPLDPPLRSRFQYFHVASTGPAHTILRALQLAYPHADANTLRALISFGESLARASQPGSPELPWDAYAYIARALHEAQAPLDAHALLLRAFPFALMLQLSPSVLSALQAGLEWVHLARRQGEREDAPLELRAVDGFCARFSAFRLRFEGDALGGRCRLLDDGSAAASIRAPVLAAMVLDHAVGRDLCVVAPRGWGKTWMVQRWLAAVGLDHVVRTVQLYEDMTARDLLQRRTTTATGDTAWEHSDVVRVALEGGCVVLDGIDQLRPGVLAALARLIEDREVELPDGTILVRPDRWALLCGRSTPERLTSLRMLPISPVFRIVAIGCTPTRKRAWVTPAVAALFKFHALPLVSGPALRTHLESSNSGGGSGGGRVIDCVLAFHERIVTLDDAALAPLSLRQLRRVCARARAFPTDVREALASCFLEPFLPLAARTALRAVLDETVGSPGHVTANVDDLVARLRRQPTNAALVPVARFFAVPSHVVYLGEMAKAWSLDEHLLLIGNQGVGKNVLADTLLQRLGVEREYVQLHRDTTVQSLTLAPSLMGGVVVYADSPLVRALVHGRCLCIDEIDKAPVEVVCVLKGLLEDRELLLCDGRRVVDASRAAAVANSLPIHPGFRVVALANRPGFPFLGNNFFAKIGDCFHAIVIDNVDTQSELQMLRSYAPDVPEFLLRTLVDLFAELRTMVDAGLLSYPYSMREIVAVAKHLQAFPSTALAAALTNVFAVDMQNPTVATVMRDVLQRHGMSLDTMHEALRVRRGQLVALVEPTGSTLWTVRPLDWAVHSVRSATIAHRPWSWRRDYSTPLRGGTTGRIAEFSELCFAFSLPAQSKVADCAVTLDGRLVVLLNSPVQVLIYDVSFESVDVFDVGAHLPYHRSLNVRPRMVVLSNGLLIVFLPMYGMLLSVDLATGSATPLQLPPSLDGSGGQPASVFNELIYPPANAVRGSAKPLHVCWAAEVNVVAAWAHKSNVVAFIHASTAPDTQSVTLDASLSLERVLHVGGTLWLLLAVGGSSALLLCHASLRMWAVDADASVVLSASPWDPCLWSVAHAALLRTEPALHDCGPVGVRVAEPTLAVSACVWLSHTRQALLLCESGALVLTPSQSNLRALVSSGEARVVVCATQLLDGRVALLFSHGEVGIYEVDAAVLDRAELEWRQKMGLAESSAPADAASAIAALSLRVRTAAGMDRKVFPSQGGAGSGNGSAGGSGGGSQGDGGSGGEGRGGSGGSGSGGAHGVKRTSGPSDASDPDALLDREIDEAQRAMARKALAEELAAIDMGQYDYSEYRRMVDQVAPAIEQLRGVLMAAEARGKERAWLRAKTSGDLDDTKLVENLAGESAVYMRRGSKAPSPLGHQQRPKRLLLSVDLSASMFRFNSQDLRLARLASLVVMFLEAMDVPELQTKYVYSIVGHSGDDAVIPLGVDFGKPPASAKQRYAVVRKMTAHAEYTQSGDHTLEATSRAVRTVFEEEADDYVVVVVSDANLQRYGVNVREFGAQLTRNVKVNAFALFIASFDDEAQRMQRDLPLGKAFVSFDTAAIPLIFKQILASSPFIASE